MKSNHKGGLKYFITFILLGMILLSMTIKPTAANLLGEEIFIKTKPYDPRDLFMGDYVQLYYEIKDIPFHQLDEEILKLKGQDPYNPFESLRGKKLYILLKKDGKFHKVDRVTLKKPRDGIYLQGKYAYPLWDENVKSPEGTNTKGIVVDYTLDRYFVPENTGKELENKARDGEIFAKVRIYKGYGLLKEIQ